MKKDIWFWLAIIIMIILFSTSVFFSFKQNLSLALENHSERIKRNINLGKEHCEALKYLGYSLDENPNMGEVLDRITLKVRNLELKKRR